MRISTSSTTLSHNAQDSILPLAVHYVVTRHTPVVEVEVKWSVFGPKTVKNGDKLYNCIGMVHNLKKYIKIVIFIKNIIISRII